MKFRWITDMGLSEFATIRAIQELNQSGELYGQKDIATHIGCNVLTVKRACAALRAKNRLSIVGSPRTGFRYILHETVSA